jgi:hypothetical protein
MYALQRFVYFITIPVLTLDMHKVGPWHRKQQQFAIIFAKYFERQPFAPAHLLPRANIAHYPEALIRIARNILILLDKHSFFLLD